ncbi:MAG TPA: type II secretion system protein GspK [Polyangiaceae bacterium]|nr:type II secretion system protein GspK [Polyangiaceae bacterium]
MSPLQKILQERARRRAPTFGRSMRTGKRRGVALVLVLGTIVILTVLVAQLYESSTSTLSAALADRDTLKAEYHARSAVNLSRLLIATEPMVRKAVDPMFQMAMKSPAPQIPVWRYTGLVLGPFNDAEGAADFDRVAQVAPDGGKNLGLSGGKFEIKIVDEDSKINVNLAARGDAFSEQRLGAQLIGLIGSPQYAEYFEAPDQDGQVSTQPQICGALVDWADPDETGYPCDPLSDKASPSDGPEDNYYQQIGLPYFRKNAAFDSLEEVRLVRGVSDDFWASFAEPDSDDPDSRVITVWGQERINVNSANAQTLLAVVCSGAPDAVLCNDPEQMMTFISAVTLAKSLTQGAPIFKSPKAFINAMRGKGRGVGPLFAFLGLEPVQFRDAKAVEKSISTESRVFSIYADGIVPGKNRETRVRIHDVIDFRSANELGSDVTLPGSDTGSSSSGSRSSGSGSADTETSDPNAPLTPEQVAAALASDPMGQIIYHRIE